MSRRRRLNVSLYCEIRTSWKFHAKCSHSQSLNLWHQRECEWFISGGEADRELMKLTISLWTCVLHDDEWKREREKNVKVFSQTSSQSRRTIKTRLRIRFKNRNVRADDNMSRKSRDSASHVVWSNFKFFFHLISHSPTGCRYFRHIGFASCSEKLFLVF